MDALLPAPVRWQEAFDDTEPAPLYAEERAAVAQSTPERQREFATVRMCARRAMASLGYQPAPLVRGRGGAPRWPTGLVGSLTHCRGFRAAAVARAEEILTLGVDAEPALPLPHGVLGLVSSSAERSAVAELAATAPGVAWDRLLFCAKEAVYKAWFPLTGRWLGIREVAVTLEPGGAFAARLPAATTEPGGFTGRWCLHHGFLLAAVACPVTDAAVAV